MGLFRTDNWLVSRGGQPARIVSYDMRLYLGVPRVVTAAGAITMTRDDFFIGVNKASGVATAVNLPTLTAADAGWQAVIKDLKLDANTNNITVTAPATINIVGGTRANTYVMNVAGQAAKLLWTGTEFAVI